MHKNLALHYRPKQLSDIIGQNHITVVLSQLIRVNQLPTGMLFCGSRGTGKTTSARVVARILNCENSSDDGKMMKSCEICSACRSADIGNSMSVVEIDAASHGLIEDIRQLREAATYANPGKVRIFIIDEAHSLSTAACNGLLKTLEEPPPDTLFILATTEPHKILETVRSRLMIFEFRRVPSHFIIERLHSIASTEQIPFTEEGLRLIADFAEGGVRDAITMAEQLTYFAGKIDHVVFREYYGIVGKEIYEQLILSIFEGHYADGIKLVRESFNRGNEGRLFIDGLIVYFKDLLLKKNGLDIDISTRVAERFDSDVILKCLEVLFESKPQIAYTVLQGVIAELTYAKLAYVIRGQTSARMQNFVTPKQVASTADFLIQKGRMLNGS